MTTYRVTSILVAIEQAIARGETLDHICATLHVEPRTVDRALRRMDAAIAQPDITQRQARTHGPRRGLRPHGTHAAHARHRAAGETPCDQCIRGERAYQAAHKRAARAAA